MKKRILWIVICSLIIYITTVVNAQASDIGFYGIGGRFSYVKPQDIDGTFGFGCQADLGTLVSTLHLYPSIEYWQKRQTEDIVYYKMKYSFSEISINSDVRYYISTPDAVKVKPFIGGGLAIIISSVSIDMEDTSGFGFDYSDSDSDTDIGLEFLGGVDLSLSKSMIGFIEIKFKFDGADTFKISSGITYLISEK